MTIIETSIRISKPVEKVFQFITDFDNQKVLNPSLTGIVMSGKLAVGTKVNYKGMVMGRAFETENEIVELEPNKKLAIKTKAAPPASDVINSFMLEKDGVGTTLHAAMDCVVMPGTEGMVVPALRNSLDQTLAAMKKAIEG